MEFLKRRPYIGFILPGFLLYTLFVVYPIFAAVQISFTHWDGIGEQVFVGFANYIELFTNKSLLNQWTNALGNSLTIFVLNVLITTPLQLYMAYKLYTKMRGHNFVQAMIFSPQFIATPVIVFLATLVLDGNIGIFNHLLRWVGLGEFARPWIGIPEYGIYIVWAMNAWAGIGVGMIFFLGAMKMIDGEMLEAAYLDGAGYWRRFFSIVLPQLKVTVLNMLILTYIFSMTVFDFSFILGGAGGGINRNMDVMALFFYRVSFGDNSAVGGTMNTNAMGMGTTIACVMFLLVFVVSVFQIILTYRQGEGGRS